MSIDKKFLDEQKEKDILQQNIGIIKMEERMILKRVLKLEYWLKIEFILVSFTVLGIGGIAIWKFLF